MLLYIDPGTGSMLFSVFIGIAAAGYFLIKAMWIKLKFIFSGKTRRVADTMKYSFVFYNEGIQYWNVFLPILREFEKRQISVQYYTSSESDPFFSMDWNYITGEFIGKGNKAFAKLNFLEADVCLMTTPGLDVYQLKRSKRVRHYAHILHAVDDATSYRLFGLDFFDSVLLSGEYQRKPIRELEERRGIPAKELPVVGCPYLDSFSLKLSKLPILQNSCFTVLISPSWGPSGILSRFGVQLLDTLSLSPFHIIIRPHPQSKKSEPELLKKLETKYEAFNNFEWDYNPENIISLSRADIMISDFSGIIFDYAFLRDKPFLYLNQKFNMEIYDASDVSEEPWKFVFVREAGIELTENMIPSIISVIQSASDSAELAEARKRGKYTAWQHIGESGKYAADFLIEKQREVSSC